MEDSVNGTLNEEELIVSELTEEDKHTVEKFQRQLSRHSILSIRSEDPWSSNDERFSVDEEADEITEEEALRLQRVIQAFQNFKQTKDVPYVDSIDGRKYRRISSNQSYEFFWSSKSSAESRFVTPGRFHVSLSEESKAIVKQMNDMIQRGKSTLRKTKSQEILIVQSEEFGSSYINANQKYSNVENNSFLLDPDNVRVDFNNENHYGNSIYRNNQSKKDFLYPRRNEMGIRHAIHSDNGHANGHPNGGFHRYSLSLLPPKEKFKAAVKRVIQSERIRKRSERDKKRKDYFEKLWKRRGAVGWFGLLLILAGPCAFIADSATDLKVASDHFTTGHPWWGTFTVMLVIFPAILMNIVSYFFYKDDEAQSDRKPGSGWRTVKITHCLQLGLIERYWHIFIKGYKIKFKKINDFQQYQLFIAMNLDTAMLQMILAFTEDAPQLVLQLYVLIRRKLVEKLLTTSLQDMWTLASICFSFISYSRALVNYNSCLRDSKPDKGQLRWYGYIAMWFWRAFMFTSRVLVLVFFATEFHLWFFAVLVLHFLIILVLTWPHKVDFFSEQKGLQVFIRVVISYIHTFCFFVLEAKKTIRWAVIYYILIALEAVIFSTLWFTNSTHYVSLTFELAGLSSIFISFGIGLLMMVAYYKFLHPKFKRPQTKWYTKGIPKEELCENVKNEHEDSEDEEEETTQDDVEQGMHDPVNRAAGVMRQLATWV